MKNKAEVPIFFIVAVVVGLLICLALWAMFSTVSETLSPEGDKFRVLGCQLSSGLASYGFLKDFGAHLPKPLCEPQEVDIDGNECNCDDFTAFLEPKYPIENLYDGTNKKTALFAKEGKTTIQFEIKQVFDYNMTSFKVTIAGGLNNQPRKVSVSIREEGLFKKWNECLLKSIPQNPGAHELLAPETCKVPKKGTIAIIFDTLKDNGTEIVIPEVEMAFTDGVFNYGIDEVLKLPPKTSGEAAIKYSHNCKREMEGGECSEKWKKQWVALKLGKLAADCWSMGLEGKKQPGAFACYGGKIENINISLVDGSGPPIVVADRVLDNVSEVMKKAYLPGTNMSYRDYLSRGKVTSMPLVCDISLIFTYIISDITDKGLESSAVSYILPPMYNMDVTKGYPSGSRYAITYTDINIRTAFDSCWNILHWSDSITFF